MPDQFEKVHTMDEYYDGPRSGLADYCGEPHYYRSVYLDTQPFYDDEDRFELSPVSPEVLAAGIEAQQIFERWDAIRPTPVAADDFGALPAERTRQTELTEFLRQSFSAAAARQRTLVRGTFHGAARPHMKMQVCWTPIPNEPCA